MKTKTLEHLSAAFSEWMAPFVEYDEQVCDTCGRWDGALEEGMCGPCRKKYLGASPQLPLM